MTPVRSAARAMLGAVFVISGAETLMHPEHFEDRAKHVTERIAPLIERTGLRLPTDTRSLVRASGAIQVAAALAMMSPLRRPAAMVLAATMVPTTLAGHAYWRYDNPDERHGHRVHFLKDLGLIGGLIMAGLDRGPAPSLAWRARAARKAVQRTARVNRSKATIAMRSAAQARRH